MTKDGLSFIIGTFVITAAIWLGWYVFPNPFVLVLALIFSFFSLFNLWFFRDPERNFSGDENDIISPADGTVIKIDRVYDDEYFKKEVTLVSVFMSVFNVHVNRFPVSGKVDYFDYRKGKFKAAFNHLASAENEQTVIGIKSDKGRVLFKQVAGLIARRIICRAKVGDSAVRGERFGMIRYGSRVDLYFEDNVTVKVKMKQKVTAGETVIASFISDK
jgi:phosphatidylserine decarboxylase